MGLLNTFDLNQYIQKYNTSIFIETGTGIGQGITYAQSFPFKQLYTIEIIKKLYDENVIKLKDNKTELILNNSISGLTEILSKVLQTDTILFWLDAHFPGADYQMGNYADTWEKNIKTPLEDELILISSIRKNNKDVFLIDDLRLYEDGNYDCGSIDRTKYGNCNGVEFVFNLFSNTHDIVKSYKHEGYLIVTPKIG